MWTWWIVATLAAFFIKGLCGFANALIFSAIMSHTANNVSITPIELLLGSPTNIIVTWVHRKYIKWNVCLPLAGLVVLGNIPGALFLRNGNAGTVKLFFGAVIVALGIEMLLRNHNIIRWQEGKAFLPILGLVSGLLSGLYGIGALNSVYISRRTANSQEFKANICFVFMVEATFRTILYTATGIITRDIAIHALKLSPLMLAGLGLGMLCCRWLNETIIRNLVIIMLIISGVAIMLTAK